MTLRAFDVLRELQIGIDQVIGGVQLLAEILAVLCRARRGDVGADQFVPVADAREDVRGHVLRVRRGRRDLGIALGGIDAFLRQGRGVVEMDQIVGDARMPRLALEDLLQDRRALELI